MRYYVTRDCKQKGHVGHIRFGSAVNGIAMADINRHSEQLVENMVRRANVATSLLQAARLVAPACDSLMAEAIGKGVTDWGAVNTMLWAIRKAIAEAEGR